jgi:hypothetical protein
MTMVNLEHIYQYLRGTDGVNQLQRSLPALRTDFVRMDERNNTDLINLVKTLAEQVRYYDARNLPQGNWLPFLNFPDTGSSVEVKVATTEELPRVQYNNGDEGVSATLTSLANGSFPAQDGVSLVTGNIILVWRQEDALQNGVYTLTQGSDSAPYILKRTPGVDSALSLSSQTVEVLEGTQHAKRLFIQQTIKPIPGITEIKYARIGLSRTDWPPHLALFMAFLKAYGIAQKDLNEMTGRHLKYYYENVLQMKRRPTQPDQVHVIFEPSKNTTLFLLPAGTFLDAGKMSDGKTPKQYALDNETIITQATVQSLKSSYTDINSEGKAIVFKADDATAVKSDTGITWRPFGSSQLNLPSTSQIMTKANLGFAIASPVLLLTEGERTIKLTLYLLTTSTLSIDQELTNNGLTSIGLSYIFDVSITGEKGWITPTVFEANYFKATPSQAPQIILTSTIPSTENAIVTYNEVLHKAGFGANWAVIRCQFKPDTFPLEILGLFEIQNIDVEVSASGVKNLVLQNDESIQPVDKPVVAFGSQPSIGSNFYIGSAEVFSKTVQSLSVFLDWKDLPDNLNTYYQGYGTSGITNNLFYTDVYLLAGKQWWNNPIYNHLGLFNSTSLVSMEIDETNFNDRISGSGFKRNPDLKELSRFDNFTSQGFIKIVLISPTSSNAGPQPYVPFEAFGHKAFPTTYAHKAIELSLNSGVGQLPNPPYTPILKSVTLDYTARENFIPSNPNGIEQFFLLDIFGNAELGKNDISKLVPDLPPQGALYVGLKNATPPQTLSLLFQIEKGDVPGAELLEKTDLTFSYLTGNKWQVLTAGDILEESTDTFQAPGIIRLNIGSDATLDGSLMPSDLHWIKITADQRADGSGAIQEIAAQAAKATLVSDAPDTVLLQPGTINKLVNKVPAIKSVIQNYPSFNGLSPETDGDFFRHTSERLRHRNRAVQTWDYERLILEAFPEVFELKCLPHLDENNFIAPGHIKLILVPDMRFRKGKDPLQPKNSLAFLRQVETFLQDNKSSAFVIPHAANPEYETLLIDSKIAFLPGFDPGFYSMQLQEDVRRFLSPWAYEEGRDIIFGGKIYKSEIVGFIEGRSYVDYVVDFQLFHRYEGEGLYSGISCMTVGFDFVVGTQPSATVGSEDGGTTGAAIGIDFVIGEPVEVAVATRPDAVLVSNAVHRIEALTGSDFQCSGVSTIGIGQMIVALDFITVS